MSSSDFCDKFLKLTGFYINTLTVQLAFRLNYLPCYSKRLIFIKAVHAVICTTATFHNKQSISFSVSVIWMETNEIYNGRNTVRELLDNRGQHCEVDRRFNVFQISK